MTAKVIAVSRDSTHRFSKMAEASIMLIEGLGVEGDAHAGVTVQHLSRIAKDPTRPNLRQVHLIHSELHDELNAQGFSIKPGDMGENITTRGLDLLGLPTRTILHIGEATIEITGLRNPCVQLDRFQPGLLKACLGRTSDGEIVRKAGVMSVVLRGGRVRAGDHIDIELPRPPHTPLAPV
jgi:MOSC domain-containing protein YiiM